MLHAITSRNSTHHDDDGNGDTRGQAITDTTMQDVEVVISPIAMSADRPRRRSRPLPVPSDDDDDGDDDARPNKASCESHDTDVRRMPEPDRTENPTYKQSRRPVDAVGYTSKSTPPSKAFSEPKKSNRSVEFADVGKYFLDSADMMLPTYVDERYGERSSYLLYGFTTVLSALSLTVAYHKHDVPRDWLTVMHSFMRAFAVSGIASLELGERHKHLHIQCTMVIHAIACKGAENTLKKHIAYWFDMWSCTGYHVKVTWLDESKDVSHLVCRRRLASLACSCSTATFL